MWQLIFIVIINAQSTPVALGTFETQEACISAGNAVWQASTNWGKQTNLVFGCVSTK